MNYPGKPWHNPDWFLPDAVLIPICTAIALALIVAVALI